jgi:predicted PurR-regulated permease PerM
MTDPPQYHSFSSGSDRGWSRSRIVFLSVSAGVILAVLVWARGVLLPFILAAIIAYVLTPLVALCERVRMPRAVAILLVYAVTLTGIYHAAAAIAPRIYDETAKLTRDLPALARNLTTKWGPRAEQWVQGLMDRMEPSAETAPVQPRPALVVHRNEDGSYRVQLEEGFDAVQESPTRWRIKPYQPDTVDRFSVSQLLREGVDKTALYLKRNVLQLIRVGQVILSTVTRAVFLTFLTLMVAGYIMHTRDSILGFLRSLPPLGARASFDRLIMRIDRGLAGVVRGQLLICLVNGILSAIGFWLFGLKYWPILSIIAAVMSIIPIFGSILSSVPAVLIGLTQDFWTALWVLLWIIGIHQVEANVLNPKIIGVAAKIHPVLVVMALLIGEHFSGLWGALLAVPTLSLGQSLFQHFRFESMPDSGRDSLRPPPVAPRGA